MTKLNLAIILALAALASSFTPSEAEAACASGTEIGVYRSRSVCLGKDGFPQQIPESECVDGGKYGAYLRHYMVIGNELYCVISPHAWETAGHIGAKIGQRADWLYHPTHCVNDPATWKIVGTYQQAVVCMYRGSGLGDIPERNCGKADYATGTVVQFGADKYCLFQNSGNASKAGWLAALMVPECEIRHRGKQVKSLGLDAMTADQCLKAATVQ